MVKFVYFDLGGVVIKDFTKTDKWSDLERELGIPENRSEEFIKYWDLIEPDITLGKSLNPVLNEIKTKFNVSVTDNYSLLIDGFVNRLEKNVSIWPVIDEVARHTPIGLLTNMYPGMYQAISDHQLLPAVEWDQIIDSTIVKMKKPEPEIYQLSQERVSATGSEILFIDNTQKNLDTAKNFQWQTLFYDSGNLEESSIKLLSFFRSIL